MTEATATTANRCFRFGRAEWAMLLPLLVATWLYSSQQPRLMYHWDTPDGGRAHGGAWPGPGVKYDTTAIPPEATEIIDHGLMWSTIVIIFWFL